AVAINSSGDIFAGTAGGVFRSTDNGDNWSEINTGLANTDIRALAINSNDHIFAGTAGGLFRSTDNGDNWLEINAGLPTNTAVGTLAINSGGDVFAGSNRGVFRSTDNGNNWNQMNTGLTSTRVAALAINSLGEIFAGTSGGVFRSTDNGDNWNEINTGLTNSNVSALATNSTGHIFAGTSGAGVFRSLASTTKVEEVASARPSSFVLEQNYPNPFNPSTTIEFALEKRSPVKLKVFDITGREVARLVDDMLTPGSYKVVFNATGLPSGIYFYRIKAGKYTHTKKLMLLK
ncbi:T9SS type A sorting domain-containing protein, partial [candidate division KSB1 bacterium]|nr:T9SS type A sorting domain-containing protein [candidate division KSB1 bacterium]